MSGIELQQQLQTMGRLTPIIFISGESHSVEIIQAMKGGAIEFLWKPFQIHALLEAIERGMAIDLDKRQLFAREAGVSRKIADFSAREKGVMRLILQGHGNKDIGEILNIQPDTIKKHRANILQKMQANHLADLMQMCQGLDIAAMLG